MQTADHPTDHQIATAYDVVTNPQDFAALPGVIGTAWFTLKQARGQTVDFNRCGRPAYQLRPASEGESAGDVLSLTQRIRARMAFHGITPAAATANPLGASQGDTPAGPTAPKEGGLA